MELTEEKLVEMMKEAVLDVAKVKNDDLIKEINEQTENKIFTDYQEAYYTYDDAVTCFEVQVLLVGVDVDERGFEAQDAALLYGD